MTASSSTAGPRNSRGDSLSRYPAGAPVGSEGTWAAQLLPRGERPAFFDFIVQNWSQYLAYVPDPPLGSGPFRFDMDAGPARLAGSRAGVQPLELSAQGSGAQGVGVRGGDDGQQNGLHNQGRKHKQEKVPAGEATDVGLGEEC